MAPEIAPPTSPQQLIDRNDGPELTPRPAPDPGLLRDERRVQYLYGALALYTCVYMLALG